MSEKTKTFENRSFRVDLDGKIKTLPGKSLKSLLGLFAHLESRGMCQKWYSSFVPAGKQVSRQDQVLPEYQSFLADRSEHICYRRLGRQVIYAAKSQVQVLKARAQEIQSLVLINSWPVAERLWSELLPDCRTPLFMLSFLEELWGINLDRLDPNGRPPARLWHRFIVVQAEVESHLSRRQNLLELSDVLETHLGSWLKQFDETLDKLDEESIP